MDTTIGNLPITGPFEVYAANIGQYIYMWTDRSAPGDIPPEIASLPAIGICSVPSDTCTVVHIDTVV